MKMEIKPTVMQIIGMHVEDAIEHINGIDSYPHRIVEINGEAIGPTRSTAHRHVNLRVQNDVVWAYHIG